MDAKKKFIYLRKAEELIQSNDLLEAKKVLEKGIQQTPNFHLYYSKLGDIYYELNKLPEAKRHYKKARLLQPKASWISLKLKKLDSLRSIDFVGIYDSYPDLTGKRQIEGGRRLGSERRCSKPGKPLVTIVTVVYNNADTLQRCIDSVKKQTYDNIEYIVIDGGSNKETLEIIKANESFIDYFVSEPDNGIYAAMNKGIKVASGDYICLLNSDDTYEPEFVNLAVGHSNKNPAVDIVYTDYFAGSKHLVAQPVSQGILLGHLHVCHNTFLTSKKAYNIVGPYDETYKIVSDAVWMREAYLKGMIFGCINKPLFTLSEGGLSSGGSEAHRRLFINEVVDSYKIHFPFITDQDAEAIYLFRFNKRRINELLQISEKYDDQELQSSLKSYTDHCFKDRDNFRITPKETELLFPDYIRLANHLNISLKAIQLETKQGPLRSILENFDNIIAKRRSSPKRVILHFISVFSAPSETFVYDLIKRLEEDSSDNFVLYEHEKLSNERPFDKKIRVFWNDFPTCVGKQLYKYLIEQIQPDIVIAHFALNEWKWAQRISGLNFDIPTLSMCHGIDVFSLKDQVTYRNYIVNEFSKRKNTAFSAVSDYLQKELIASGVPRNKVHKIHNTVNPIFFEHRKNRNFYDYRRTLKLLSIGRLIAWKGHEYLINALKEFKIRATDNFELTIVYGGGDELLQRLTDLTVKNGLENHIKFEAFVDFQSNPSYFYNFDLFVHPSTYDQKRKNSETFGVAVLEAISSGLPIVSTNAGGLPEVVGGHQTPHARLVKHGDASSLSEGLIEAWKDSRTFSDNLSYAKERLETFSASKQIKILESVVNRVTRKAVKVALFSTGTIQGAGYAAYRLHQGLRDTTIESHLYTTVRNHEDQPDVIVLKHPSGDNKQWNALQLKPKEGLTIFTVDHPHISSQELIKIVEPYDIINLHWHARFLSIENIETLTHLNKPVVMTIRDMMPITGGCHYFHGCEKWKDDCSNCPQINSIHTDFPSLVLDAKRKYYNFENLTLVALSNHTKNILERSPYFSNCRIEVIPNSIETDVFRPYDKMACREEFGLPKNKKIVGYVPSFSSEVKGYKEFLKAMEIVQNEMGGEAPFVMLVGNETPATKEIKQSKKALGYISDNNILARAYSSADLVVVPSLEETFSNTTAESISCGTPVVGFNTGAIPDLAVEGISGYSCTAGDFKSLANKIMKCLNAPPKENLCRNYAVENLEFSLQSKKYENLFLELLEKNTESPKRYQCAPVYRSFDDKTAILNKIAVELLLN